jgi:hypothetical protein
VFQTDPPRFGFVFPCQMLLIERTKNTMAATLELASDSAVQPWSAAIAPAFRHWCHLAFLNGCFRLGKSPFQSRPLRNCLHLASSHGGGGSAKAVAAALPPRRHRLRERRIEASVLTLRFRDLLLESASAVRPAQTDVQRPRLVRV